MRIITEEGVAIAEDQTCVLPKPSLQPGQDAAKRKEVLVDLAGGRGWKHFSRKSISAPVATEVKYIKNADGDRIGHQVHNAFIVHASWDKLKDADLSDQLFLESAPPDNVAARKLDPAEWKAAGIDAIAENESFGLVELPLLERVVVRGVMRRAATSCRPLRQSCSSCWR